MTFYHIKDSHTTSLNLLPGFSFIRHLANGILVRAAIGAKEHEKAIALTGRYLKLCSDNGIYEYFRLRKAYDPVLEFAYDNGIEPEFTKQMMEFAGCRPKKVYIETLGAFTVYQDRDRLKILKFRTKKERELLAFLLDAGDQGATKEQIIMPFGGSRIPKILKT